VLLEICDGRFQGRHGVVHGSRDGGVRHNSHAGLAKTLKKILTKINGQGKKGASSDDFKKKGDVIVLQDVILVAHPEPSP
jgi:hypothetical protein